MANGGAEDRISHGRKTIRSPVRGCVTGFGGLPVPRATADRRHRLRPCAHPDRSLAGIAALAAPGGTAWSQSQGGGGHRPDFVATTADERNIHGTRQGARRQAGPVPRTPHGAAGNPGGTGTGHTEWRTAAEAAAGRAGQIPREVLPTPPAHGPRSAADARTAGPAADAGRFPAAGPREQPAVARGGHRRQSGRGAGMAGGDVPQSDVQPHVEHDRPQRWSALRAGHLANDQDDGQAQAEPECSPHGPGQRASCLSESGNGRDGIGAECVLCGPDGAGIDPREPRARGPDRGAVKDHGAEAEGGHRGAVRADAGRAVRQPIAHRPHPGADELPHVVETARQRARPAGDAADGTGRPARSASAALRLREMPGPRARPAHRRDHRGQRHPKDALQPAAQRSVVDPRRDGRQHAHL